MESVRSMVVFMCINTYNSVFLLDGIETYFLQLSRTVFSTSLVHF